MVKNVLISVVIPVYNVERYLRQCLDSVLCQTYKNLEIICINDASTDSSRIILGEYSKKDSRIKIIDNKENIGLGLSRNKGLKVATGDYVHCLDSDDWIKPELYEAVVNAILSKGFLDVFVFGFTYYDEKIKRFFDSGEYVLPDFLNNKVVNFNTTPQLINHWVPSAWCKIINLEFIKKNELYYNDYRCLEDIEYCLYLLKKTQTLYYIPSRLLYYRSNRKNSLLTKRLSYIDNIIKDMETTINLSQDMPELARVCILNYMYHHLVSNSLGAYYQFKLTFNKLKSIFINYINIDVLSQEKKFKYYVDLYHKVVNYSSLHFRFSYCFRLFIRRNFPCYTKLYFKLKNKLVGKNV